jgi:uncharacterized membrane protein YhhN
MNLAWVKNPSKENLIAVLLASLRGKWITQTPQFYHVKTICFLFNRDDQLNYV